MYSEKATNFCKIPIVDLSYVVRVKSMVEISQNCVAFSEYMNFKYRSTVNPRYKKDTNIFLDNRFLDSVYKYFLNQTTLDLRKEKRSFLNRDLPVLRSHFRSKLFGLSQIYFGSIEAKSQRSLVPWNGRISKWDSWFWITVLPTLYYLCAGTSRRTGGRRQGRSSPPDFGRYIKGQIKSE